MSAVLDYFQYVWNQLRSIRVVDVLDILIVAFVFYYIFQFMRKRRAARLLAGIVLLIGILLISSVAQMKALNFLLSNVFSVGILSLIVVFQPELRSFLEKVGGTTFRNIRGKLDASQKAALVPVIREVCIAAEYFSQHKTGALIVFARNTKLEEYVRSGTVLDATISAFLLENVFFNKAPMHDGAAIISEGRLHAAGCVLPLSTNADIIKELGTRHRAGIGMSENSDAVVLIVSEENGIISLAVEGELQRGFDRKSLETALNTLLLEDEALTEKVVSRVRGKLSRKGQGGKKA